MKALRELHLFAGIGGGVLGGLQLGHRPVAAVELDPYCQQVLRERQLDGSLPAFPLYDDVRTFDGKPWRGRVDIVAGGFPCQDISVAGSRKGLEGPRSSLWFEMLRVVGEIRPRYVFVENSPMLRTRGLETVLGGLAGIGYDAAWTVLSAEDVGAPHLRKRMWILAERQPDPDADGRRCEGEWLAESGEQGACGHKPDGLRSGGSCEDEVIPDAERMQLREQPGRRSGPGWADPGEPAIDGEDGELADTSEPQLPAPEPAELLRAGRWEQGGAATERGWWGAEPPVGRVVARGSRQLDRCSRLKALGNAQVPLQAATAFRHLKQILDAQRTG